MKDKIADLYCRKVYCLPLDNFRKDPELGGALTASVIRECERFAEDVIKIVEGLREANCDKP
jgi:hypothetical protein